MAARRSKRWVRTRDSHFVTTYPKMVVCPHCRYQILGGWEQGLWTLYDTYQLSPIGEAEAILRGIRTFHANHPHFGRRNAWTTHCNPHPKQGFIVRQHFCDTPPPIPKCIKPIETEFDLPDLPDF